LSLSRCPQCFHSANIKAPLERARAFPCHRRPSARAEAPTGARAAPRRLPLKKSEARAPARKVLFRPKKAAAPMRCTASLPSSTTDRKPVASSLPARCAASVCFGGGAPLSCGCRSVALSHESCLRFALRPIHGFVGSPVPLAFSPALVSGLGAAPEDRDTQTSNHTKADHR
jgi:hypothetical protein